MDFFLNEGDVVPKIMSNGYNHKCLGLIEFLDGKNISNVSQETFFASLNTSLNSFVLQV